MSIAHDAHSIDAPAIESGNIPAFKAAIVIALAALADWLFFRHSIGISAAMFLAALAAAAIAANPLRASRREIIAAAIVLIVSFVPMVLQPGFFATLYGALGVAYAAISTTETGTRWSRRLRDAGKLIFDTTWRAIADINRALHTRPSGKPPRLSGLIGWIIPLGLGVIFLALFANANPLIESFFSGIDLSRLFAQLDFWRTMLWLLIVALVWPFVFIRRSAALENVAEQLTPLRSDQSDIELPATLFNSAAILRSLVLFNAIFAVQTALDLTYLWGGAALPSGMGYAAYAHRGAYPLIATALLAASFVIVALRPGSEAERLRPIRLLVFAWIAQNVLLVSSSILRLDLYVQIYSLSYWRLAAGIWMGLVVAGLLLIVARIALGRSNRWLVGMNFAALAVTLYAVNLVNLPAIIADYNVSHSREFTGKGTALDTCYLASLGPDAIPALDRFIERAADAAKLNLTQTRTTLYWRHYHRMKDWRAWSVYDGRLSRYLKIEYL